jgi:hypothetical protein
MDQFRVSEYPLDAGLKEIWGSPSSDRSVSSLETQPMTAPVFYPYLMSTQTVIEKESSVTRRQNCSLWSPFFGAQSLGK